MRHEKGKVRVHEEYISLKTFSVHQIFFSNKKHFAWKLFQCYAKQNIFLSWPKVLLDKSFRHLTHKFVNGVS